MKSFGLTASFLALTAVLFLNLSPLPSVKGIKCFVCTASSTDPPLPKNLTQEEIEAFGYRDISSRPCTGQSFDCSKRDQFSNTTTCHTETSDGKLVRKKCGEPFRVKPLGISPGCHSFETVVHKITENCFCEGDLCNKLTTTEGGVSGAQPGPKIGLLTLLGLVVFIPFGLFH